MLLILIQMTKSCLKISPKVEQLISDISWDGELNWENHKRTPFPHQDIGVRWILGVEQKTSDSKVSGALLADDMGLGKTLWPSQQ